jgi:hypothetical protein
MGRHGRGQEQLQEVGRDWSKLRSDLAERYAEVTALKSHIVNVAAQMETHLQCEQLLAVRPGQPQYLHV